MASSKNMKMVRKRLPSPPPHPASQWTAEFSKKSKTFMGYDTLFLTSSHMLKLKKSVTIIKCPNNRIGIVDINKEDKRKVMLVEAELFRKISQGNRAKKFKSIFPTKLQIEENGSDIIFASIKDVKCFNS